MMHLPTFVDEFIKVLLLDNHQLIYNNVNNDSTCSDYNPVPKSCYDKRDSKDASSKVLKSVCTMIQPKHALFFILIDMLVCIMHLYSLHV